jgi:hypothetical protein
MDWQEMVALGIVGATSILFAWRFLIHNRKKSFQKSSGCCGPSLRGSQNSLIVSGKRGEQAKLIFKQRS